MKNKLKIMIGKIKSQYYYNNRTRAFNNRYKAYDTRLFENKLPKHVIDKYIKKWSVFGKKVETKTFVLSVNLSDKVDFNVIPENIFSAIIERKININKEISFFAVKNVYEKWFNKNGVFPESYFHKIDNVYYNNKMEYIPIIKDFIENKSDFIFPLVLKPSKDTYGGDGVLIVKDKQHLLKSIKDNSHLICQEKIEQNIELAKINNSSVNSVRVCLYRTLNGSFEVLNSAIRFGINGGLDNLSSGGIVCLIKDNGKFNSYAVNRVAKKFEKHPNSGKIFNGLVLPNYEDLIHTSKIIADEIILSNLVSLDMVLDNNGNWRCLEINLSGQTIRFAQYAGVGFFGEFTDEVIDRVLSVS